MTAERATDWLLWRLRSSVPLPDMTLQSIRSSVLERVGPSKLQRHAFQSEKQLAYVYVSLTRTSELPVAVLAQLVRPGDCSICRLQLQQDVEGASSTVRPTAHYVVETDAEPGWMPAIRRWYFEEHLPALARVAGCVRARRFVNHDEGPESLACYDLVDEWVTGRREWLAVRETPWSRRTRPHFTNTRRTLFAMTETDRT